MNEFDSGITRYVLHTNTATDQVDMEKSRVTMTLADLFKLWRQVNYEQTSQTPRIQHEWIDGYPFSLRPSGQVMFDDKATDCFLINIGKIAEVQS